MASDSQSRKYLITINNPQESDWSHENIKQTIATMKPALYYCMSDEIAPTTNTYHTHLYVHCRTPVRFSTVKKKFPTAHIDLARGTAQQNREYVFKLGEKYENTEKEDSRVDGTQEEWGECPQETQGQKPEMTILLELIQSGLSDYDIITQYPDYLFDSDRIARVRLILKQEEYKEKWRNLEVTYIYGKTGTGKTKGVMEKYGYSNVFRVTSYIHPFDTYQGENVILMDEFNSSIKLTDFNIYTEGYPCKLPCRYSDKVACYNIVYIISNIGLEHQYPNIKDDSMSLWQAFIRRINRVVWYKDKDKIFTYDTTDDYFNRDPITGWVSKFMDF